MPEDELDPAEGDGPTVTTEERATQHGGRIILSDAAVEMLEATPRRAARAWLYLLIPFVAASAAWIAIAKVDRIVVADAVLVAEGDLLKVRAPLSGILDDLTSMEGANVTSGAVLFTVSSPEAAKQNAEIQRTKRALEIAVADLEKRLPEEQAIQDARAEQTAQRIAALEQLIEKNKDVAARQKKDSDATIQAKELEAKTKRALLPDLDAEIAARKASLARMTKHIENMEKVLSERDLEPLRDGADTARIALGNTERQRRQTEADVAALEVEVARVKDALALKLAEIEKEDIQSRAQAAALRAETLQTKGDFASHKNSLIAKRDMAQLEYDSAIAVAVKGLSEDRVIVRAPVDGVVTEVLVRQRGELVSAHDTILSLRPASAKLVAEVKVLNQHIGNVKVGQKAKIKYEAFPFTDYGIQSGVVSKVPPDATPDKVLGPVYLVTVVPDETTIRVHGEKQPLSFGLKASVEIVTDEDPILSFVLKPFRQLRDASASMPR